MAGEPDEEVKEEGAAAPEPKAEEAPQQEAASDDSSPTPSDIEALAREMGWAPKDEWRGDETDWKDAKAFVKHTVDVNRTLSKDVRELRAQTERMAKTSAKIMERELAKQRASIEARFENAVADGDVKAARKAQDDLRRLESEAGGEPGTDEQAVEAFIERNPWFKSDPDAAAYAYAVCERYKATLPVDQQLLKAEEAVKKRFPEHFPAPRKQPVVHEPGSRSSATPRGKTFNDLPADARAACLEYEKKGVKREEYVKTYFEENA